MSAAVTRVAAGRAMRVRLVDAAISRLEMDPDASFDAMAADVGVTKGALYHHFGSKDGLIEEVYKDAVRRHADRVIAASGVGSGRERLRALISASARQYGSGTPFYRLLLRLQSKQGCPGLIWLRSPVAFSGASAPT